MEKSPTRPAKPFEHLHQGIAERRARIDQWLNQSSPELQSRTLGTASETEVKEHLHLLDKTLDQSEAGELGICRVCHEPVERDLIEVDFKANVCLDHLSEPEARSLEHELELAQSMQKTLLPQAIPAIDGLQIAAYSRPAQIVTGDTFDFYEFADGRMGVAIGDAAGHGVSAGLQMAGLQSLLRALVSTSESPGEVMSRIHGLYRHNFRFTTLVSMFLLAVDPQTGAFSFVNAGHNPPLLVRHGSDDLESLMPTGPALGLTEEAVYSEPQVTLQVGDALVLYTDGIPEAFDANGSQFGQERLIQVVKAAAGGSAQELLRQVRESLQAFLGSDLQSDDVTLVTLKRVT